MTFSRSENERIFGILEMFLRWKKLVLTTDFDLFFNLRAESNITSIFLADGLTKVACWPRFLVIVFLWNVEGQIKHNT